LADVQKALLEKMGVGLGNRFSEQAQSYVGTFVALGGKPADALDRLVASKVLRKVERERDPNRRQEVEAIQEVIRRIPGGAAPRSEALLARTLKALR
jgi:hypothetical protein